MVVSHPQQEQFVTPSVYPPLHAVAAQIFFQWTKRSDFAEQYHRPEGPTILAKSAMIKAQEMEQEAQKVIDTLPQAALEALAESAPQETPRLPEDPMILTEQDLEKVELMARIATQGDDLTSISWAKLALCLIYNLKQARNKTC